MSTIEEKLDRLTSFVEDIANNNARHISHMSSKLDKLSKRLDQIEDQNDSPKETTRSHVEQRSLKTKNDSNQVEFSPDYLIQEIEIKNNWDYPEDGPKNPLHEELIAAAVTNERNMIITPHQQTTSASEAAAELEKQIQEIKDAGYLSSFAIKSRETNFHEYNPKEIMIEIYHTLAKLVKKYEKYHLLLNVFLVGTIRASGGLFYKEKRQAAILRELALTSKIFDNVIELFDFHRLTKSAVQIFLMEDLGWKRHQALSSRNTLEEIIHELSTSDNSPIHPALRSVQSSKSKNHSTMQMIIEGTADDIYERYDRHNMKKSNFSNSDPTWVDANIMTDIQKIGDPSTTSEEKDRLIQHHIEYLSNMNHMLAEYDIFHWVTQLKLGVHDEKLKPKMTEFWIEFNKQIEKNPTQNFAVWTSTYLKKYSTLGTNIKEGQLYNLMQSSLQGANSHPFSEVEPFIFSIDYSLNAIVPQKPKQGGKKKSSRGKNNLSSTKQDQIS